MEDYAKLSNKATQMTPDEREMQEKKIRLMGLALVLGIIYGLTIIYLLAEIAYH